MTAATVEELRVKKCKPCEGGVPLVPREDAEDVLASLPGWTLSDDGKCIRREWLAKNFMAAMHFFNQVAELAEDEGHRAHCSTKPDDHRDSPWTPLVSAHGRDSWQ